MDDQIAHLTQRLHVLAKENEQLRAEMTRTVAYFRECLKTEGADHPTAMAQAANHLIDVLKATEPKLSEKIERHRDRAGGSIGY
jgi:predicted  nucleic acid-binding Zn-ribbon protein